MWRGGPRGPPFFLGMRVQGCSPCVGESMCQVRTSRSSGIWRFSWLALWVLLLAFGTCEAGCDQWTQSDAHGTPLGSFGDPWSAAGAYAAACNNGTGTVSGSACAGTCSVSPSSANCTGFTVISCTFEGFPTVACVLHYTQNGSSLSFNLSPVGVAEASCPACAVAGSYAFVGGSAPPGYACVGGCQYQTPQPSLQINGGSGGAGSAVTYDAYSTGQACGQNAATTPTSPSQEQSAEQCDSSGTVCASGSSPSSGCGEFNGDQVCVNTIKPGTCVSYASGGAACAGSGTSGNTFVSPPVPGTSGTPAAPSGQVVTNTETYNYYSSSSVSGATTPPTVSNPIQSEPNGTQGTGGSGGGSSGSVSVTNTVSVAGSVSVVPNAANGDCGAAGVNCTGTAPSAGSGSTNPGSGGGPETWSGDCTSFQDCLSNFYSSIQSAPLVSGAAGIETAWPSGTCDIGSVTLATLNNQTFNYGTTACEVWTSYIATPLAAILLAVYAVAGVFIVLSA